MPFFSWKESLDGYLIQKNANDFFEYLTVEKGKIKLSGIRVEEKQERSKFNSKLNKIKKELVKEVFFAKSKKYLKEQSSQNVVIYSNRHSLMGKKKLLCILVEFEDVPFTKTRQNFDDLMNKKGYSFGSAQGSVKDYYSEVSYGQLDLEITVVGPYKLSHKMRYYGEDKYDSEGNRKGDLRPRELIKEAVLKANPDVNYSYYDNDKDGVVDGIHVVFSGYDQSASEVANAIWSHKSNIEIKLDGKLISKYSCSSELRSNSGNSIAGIGTICHELGHVFGAPDFYDTSDNNRTFLGTGNWDVMAGGCWNNNGDSPAHHNPYTKAEIFGWTSIKDLPNSGEVILNPAETQSNSFYKIDTKTPGEYFILENRQKLGFDNHWYFPGHGLIIYHVHSQFSSTGEDSQKNNITHPQKFYPVCASASQNPQKNNSNSYGAINSGGCPFPGFSNKQYFTSTTTPALISWNGESTEKNIYFIRENGRNIMFRVNPSIIGSTIICDQANYSIEALPVGAKVEWKTSNNKLQLVKAEDKSATFKKNGNGECTIVAKITSLGIELTKEVGVGIPQLLGAVKGSFEPWDPPPYKRYIELNLQPEPHNEIVFDVKGCQDLKEWIINHNSSGLYLNGIFDDRLIVFRGRARGIAFFDVSVKNECGCSSPVYVTVDTDSHRSLLTPNGDGVNDTFEITETAKPNTYSTTTTDHVYNLTIFNNEGNVVYAKDNYMQDDERFVGVGNTGNYANVTLSGGNYYYTLTGSSNRSGTIYLERE